MLGDRPCVRQSKLYREHDGGNAMKEIMGNDGLKWDTGRQEGAYYGMAVHDANKEGKPDRRPHPSANAQAPPQGQAPDYDAPAQPVPVAQATPPTEPQQKGHRVGAYQANVQSEATCEPFQRHRVGAGQANKQSYNILTGQ